MSPENDENQLNDTNFPIILKPQRSIISKNDSLRRNTPISPRYRKPGGRIVSKGGRVRIHFKKIPQKSLQYAKDLWNTLVNMQWRWLIFTVTIVNVLAYIGCAILFFFDSWISGDFEDETDDKRCMVGIQDPKHFFMLGIETVTTTGYGYIHPTENCKLYFIVLTCSTLIGILIDGMFISVVYAKLNRSKGKNKYGPILSRKAVISLRNGNLCLIVRVNDRDGKHWINTQINMYLIKDVVTQEEELIPNHVIELGIRPFGMLFWPVEIIHEITPETPLWNMSAKELMTTRLEILVVVSGSSLKTGQSTRSQTSYLNKEIMWGYQFAPCLEYNEIKRTYLIDKKYFQHTIPQEVPLCSAKTLKELQKQINGSRQSLDSNRLRFIQQSEQNIRYFKEI